ncbi:hypothetical protein, partial [Chimaeribacter arupi]|uniref:hypothetical protein n=1 Tax=Chimaeribacter arupi TaxID=2060066 RepID=UPI0019D4879F
MRFAANVAVLPDLSTRQRPKKRKFSDQGSKKHVPAPQKQKAPIFIGACFLSGRCGRDALAPSLALALRVAAPCKTA